MIVWLASYPRSGNTLLRTILKQCMNINSYDDSYKGWSRDPIVGMPTELKSIYGHIEYPDDWLRFYENASKSETVYIVKTHLPPIDDQPVIYVIRDGRSATDSYLAYHQSFQSDTGRPSSLYQLMVGDDYYGNWSSHHQQWQELRKGPQLLVYFEELVEPNSNLLKKIAGFVRHAGNIKPFDNPLSQSHQKHPGFFRQGKKNWVRPSHWSEMDEAVFLYLHQKLMLKMGFVNEQAIAAATRSLAKDYLPFLELAKQGFEQRNSWLHEAEAKEKVIRAISSQSQPS